MPASKRLSITGRKTQALLLVDVVKGICNFELLPLSMDLGQENAWKYIFRAPSDRILSICI